MLELVTPAAGLLAYQLLDDIKAHIPIDGDCDNARIIGYIESALAIIEQATGRSFEATTWKETYADFPCPWRLAKSPTQSISWVKYYNLDNVLTTYTDYYLLKPTFQVARLMPVGVWPEVYDRPDAVQVQYVAAWSPINPTLKALVRQLVAQMDEVRTQEIVGTIVSDQKTLTFERMINSLKSWRYS